MGYIVRELINVYEATIFINEHCDDGYELFSVNVMNDHIVVTMKKKTKEDVLSRYVELIELEQKYADVLDVEDIDVIHELKHTLKKILKEQ